MSGLPVRATLLALAAALAACNRGNAPPDAPPLSVKVAVVSQEGVPLYIEHTGTTEAVKSVDLRARVQGFLVQAPFKEGADVQEGDLLFVIEQAPYRTALDQAKAALARAQAAFDSAQSDYKRVSELAKRDVSSRSALDKATAARDETAAAVRGAQAALEKAALDFSYTEVRAPFSGRIGKLRVDVGNVVGSNGETVLANLVQLDPIYVYFGAPERERLEVLKRRSEGEFVPRDQIQAQLVLADGAVYPHAGKIDFVDNTVDPNAGTVRVRVIAPNPEKTLLPGQYANVRLLMGQDQKALLVPEQAILADQGGNYVLVVKDDGTVESRPVVPTQRIDGKRVIGSGLAAGERVLIDHLQQARPGMKVVAQTASPAEAPDAAPAPAPAPPEEAKAAPAP
jgi:membrane fusion protein (multidrug efflux system)